MFASQALMPTSSSNEEDPSRSPKVALHCFNCSGPLIWEINMKDHLKVCRAIPRTFEHWSRQNFRPIARHDKNPSLLRKWLACPKCRLQRILARSPERSFPASRLKLLYWARLVFLLTSKHKVKRVWAQACICPFLIEDSLGVLIDFLA